MKNRCIGFVLMAISLNFTLQAVQDSSEYYNELYRDLNRDYTFEDWKSTEKIDRCILFFTKNEDSVLLSQSFVTLSNYRASHGKYNTAFDALWKALAIAKAIGDIQLQHDAHLHLARLYNVFDKNEEAYLHEQIVLKLAKEGVKQGLLGESSIVSAYYDFVHYSRKTGRYEDAMNYLDTCYQLADQFNYSYDDRAYLLSERGHVLMHQGRLKEAIELLEESKGNFLRINPSYLSIIFFYLGSAYETDGQLLIAKDYYTKTVENINKTNLHFDTKAEALLRISKILNRMGDYKRAYSVLIQSKELFDNMFSAKSSQNESLLSIRNLYQEQMYQKDLLIQQQEHELSVQKAAVIRFRLFLITAMALIIIGALFGYLAYQRRRFKTEREAQLVRLQLQEQNNRALVELKNKELTSFTLRLIDKDSLIDDLTETIKEYAPENKTLLKSVKQKTTGRLKLWEEFDRRFVDVNKGFYENLKAKYPSLTPTELKHCALIKLNFSAKEMAQLLNISLHGVNTSRYRIRKKLHLDREDNLVSVIAAI